MPVIVPKPRTQIYILCHDRVAFGRESIGSAVHQDIGDIEVVVSDNSDGDDVGKMVLAEFPQVTYIRRRPVLSSADHFLTVLRECSAEHVVLFHDDDKLEPSYVRLMRHALDTHPEVVAVGCNARILRDTTLTDHLHMLAFDRDLLLKSQEELACAYLRFNKFRSAPFPSYMYRLAAIENLRYVHQDEGKYGDVIMLIRVATQGHLMWLGKPLMQYRIHGANDTGQLVIGHILRLLRFIYRNTAIRPHSEPVQEYRFRYWLRWWRSLSKQHTSRDAYRWRRRVVFAHLWRQALRFALTQPGFWLRIAHGAK